MDDWTKLFDLLLQNVAAYPVTIWNLIFHPLAVFQQLNSARRCPPGLTYLFTVSLFYAWLQMGSSREKVKLPDWLTRDFLLGLALVYVAVIVNVQQYAAHKLIGLSNLPLNDQLGALVYAFCPVLLLGIIFGAVGWFKPESIASGVAGLGLSALYVWCLYNVSRAAFSLSPGKAVRVAFLAWGSFIGVVIVVVCIAWLVGSRAKRQRQ